MADGGVVVMKLGNAGGAKAPCCDAKVQSGKSPGTGASLSAPLDSVRTLQSTLRAKAKSEAATCVAAKTGTGVAHPGVRTTPTGIWLRRRSGKRGTGYRQYSDQYLYEKLRLIRLMPAARDRSNAKA